MIEAFDLTARANCATLSIHLGCEHGSDIWHLKLIEYVLDEMSVRLNYKELPAAADNIAPELYEYIQPHLTVRGQRALVTDPNFLIALEGLRLGRLRILVQNGADGQRSAIVRFAKAVGHCEAVIRPERRSGNLSRISANDQLLSTALIDVIAPCMELAEIDDIDLTNPLMAAALRMKLQEVRRSVASLESCRALLSDLSEHRPELALQGGQGA